MTTTTARWHRHPMGYLSDDGEWFAERGARMSDGGTAWLVWQRLTDDDDPDELVTRDLTELAENRYDHPEGDALYQHVGDAGSLAEAKTWRMEA